MDKLLTKIGVILSFARYLIFLLIFLLLVGVAGIFFGGQNSQGNFIFDYGDFILKHQLFIPY